MNQALELSNLPHIVVATPGRFAEHIRCAPSVNLDNLQFLVLDEADRLLEPCFDEDLSAILNKAPKGSILTSPILNPNP